MPFFAKNSWKIYAYRSGSSHTWKDFESGYWKQHVPHYFKAKCSNLPGVQTNLVKGGETSRGTTHKMFSFLLIIFHVSKWIVELMKAGFLWMCILWLDSLVSSKMWVLIEVFPTVGAFIISHCLKAVSSSIILSFRLSINGFSFCTCQPVFINPVKTSYLWDFYPQIKFN